VGEPSGWGLLAQKKTKKKRPARSPRRKEGNRRGSGGYQGKDWGEHKKKQKRNSKIHERDRGTKRVPFTIALGGRTD